VIEAKPTSNRVDRRPRVLFVIGITLHPPEREQREGNSSLRFVITGNKLMEAFILHEARSNSITFHSIEIRRDAA